jgi:hypothetical protein
MTYLKGSNQHPLHDDVFTHCSVDDRSSRDSWVVAFQKEGHLDVRWRSSVGSGPPRAPVAEAQGASRRTAGSEQHASILSRLAFFGQY